ncbi:MAG: helix-turn-helix domain-containing protein, partial [Candidatus Nanopelagicales bacterium]
MTGEESVSAQESTVTELVVSRRTPRRAEKRERIRMSGQERREQLLDVGRRLFAKKGFEAVSVEEIAAKAGVSKPVVYEHFGGK